MTRSCVAVSGPCTPLAGSPVGQRNLPFPFLSAPFRAGTVLRVSRGRAATWRLWQHTGIFAGQTWRGGGGSNGLAVAPSPQAGGLTVKRVARDWIVRLNRLFFGELHQDKHFHLAVALVTRYLSRGGRFRPAGRRHVGRGAEEMRRVIGGNPGHVGVDPSAGGAL